MDKDPSKWERKHGALILAKAILIDERSRVLVLRRGQTAPVRPLHWDLPGGVVEYGEEPVVACVRETVEETGIRVESLGIVDVRASGGPVYDVTVFYTAKAPSADVKLSYEHDLYKWVGSNEVVSLGMPGHYTQSILSALA